jgi:hypothetical protein
VVPIEIDLQTKRGPGRYPHITQPEHLALTLTKSDPVMLKIIDPPAARMFTEMGERPKRFVVV